MTVFQCGQNAPRWCELQRFELISPALGATVERRPETASKRLIGDPAIACASAWATTTILHSPITR